MSWNQLLGLGALLSYHNILIGYMKGGGILEIANYKGKGLGNIEIPVWCKANY